MTCARLQSIPRLKSRNNRKQYQAACWMKTKPHCKNVKHQQLAGLNAKLQTHDLVSLLDCFDWLQFQSWIWSRSSSKNNKLIHRGVGGYKKGNRDCRRSGLATALFVAVLSNAISSLADMKLLSQQGLWEQIFCWWPVSASLGWGTRPAFHTRTSTWNRLPPPQITQSRVGPVIACHLNLRAKRQPFYKTNTDLCMKLNTNLPT